MQLRLQRARLARGFLTGQNSKYAWRPQGFSAFDGAYSSVRIGTPDKGNFHHARQGDVIKEAAPARQESGVLDPLDARADQLGGTYNHQDLDCFSLASCWLFARASSTASTMV